MPRTLRRLDHHDDRGAVLPLVAATLVVLLMSAAFAVDLGMQRVVARDAQATADVIALDMARLLDGRPRGQVEADPRWAARLAQVRAANASQLGDAHEVVVESGHVDPATGAFTAVGTAEVPTAVRAIASGNVAFAFAPVGGGPSEGGATRSAVAQVEEGACFALGSWAAGLDTEQSALLSPLAAAAGVDLTAIGYAGIADLDATVPLVDLAAALDVGTAEELAAVELPLRDFYLVVADVLQRNGDTAAALALQAIPVAVGALDPVAIADLVALGAAADTALSSRVNVLDLVTAGAFVANGENALAVEDLGIDLTALGLGTATTSSLQVIQRPQIGCGPVGEATADTAQVSVDLGGPLVGIDTAALLPLLGSLANTSVTAGMQLSVDAASAHGTLRDIRCATAATPDGISVEVASSLAEVRLSVPIQIRGQIRLSLLPGILPVIPVADVVIGVTAQVTNPPSPGTRLVDLDFPVPASYDQPVPGGASGLSLSGAQITTTAPTTSVTLLAGIELGIVNGIVAGIVGNVGAIATAVVQPLTGQLDALLLGPLGDLTGLSIAGADVFGIEAPRCDAARLVG